MTRPRLDRDGEPPGGPPRGKRRVSLLIHHRDGIETVPLREGEAVLIGRSAPSTVRIADSSLSREHARFELTDGQVTVVDRRSTNGTFVHGRQIGVTKPTVVQPTDEIVLGSLRAFVHVLSPAEGTLPGFCSYERFRVALEDEVLRARHYSRSFGVLMVRALGPQVTHWSGRVLSRLTLVDRASVYGPTAIEILLPERSREAVMNIAGEIAGKDDPKLLVGVALFPGGAASAEELLEQSREAAARASVKAPVLETTAGRLDVSNEATREDETDLIARSREMKKVMKEVAQLADAPYPVLLQGETGVGKEVVARAIHNASRRRRKEFIAVNCAAIPAHLVAATLFGHVKGTFTGATQDRIGVFEAANGGTVLLDEIGDLPLEMQPALLRTLATQTVTRVGATKEVPIDVRVISATHRDLEAMLEAGTFREDLFFRLNTLTIKVPPLRAREDEIKPLAMRFLRRASAVNRKSVTGFTPGALELMHAYTWPGNVRELENAVERAVAIAVSDTITEEDLPARVRAAADRDPPPPSRPKSTASAAPETPATLRAPPAMWNRSGPRPSTTDNVAAQPALEPLQTSVEREEKARILAVLAVPGQTQKSAAALLGISLRTLANKMKKHNITRMHYTVSEPADRLPSRGSKTRRKGP